MNRLLKPWIFFLLFAIQAVAAGEEIIILDQERVEGLWVLSEGKGSKVEINGEQFDAQLRKIPSNSIRVVEIAIPMEGEKRSPRLMVEFRREIEVGQNENFGLIVMNRMRNPSWSDAGGVRRYYLNFESGSDAIDAVAAIIRSEEDSQSQDSEPAQGRR